MKKKAAYFVKILFILLGSFLFTQIPSFTNQYYHQLVGHAEELALQVQKLKLLAIESGKSLDQYINKFKASSDIDFQRHALFLEEMVLRFDYLQRARQSLEKIVDPLSFFRSIGYLDKKIFSSTWKVYLPTVPFTLDAFLWALAGAFFGYGIYVLCFRFFTSKKIKS